MPRGFTKSGSFTSQTTSSTTILFSDVRGFTSKYDGTLDKYIGDAIMAFWAAPVEDPRHARSGVLAGLEMQKECEVLNAKLAVRWDGVTAFDEK